tara:strand:- start:1467 stop:2705 length:1239 start_codon:yes stop_codon:yes gene_type:complete
MAKKKKEKVAKKATEEKVDNKVDENITKVDLSKFSSKDDDNVVKVDLDNIEKKEKEDAVQEPKTEKVDVEEQTGDGEKVDGGKQEQPALEEIVVQEEKPIQDENTPIVEEVKEEQEVKEVTEVVEDAIAESIETGEKLPESIQKLMEFMDTTGGDLSDYVKLSKDYSKLDNQELLQEYYKQTKPHLDQEEINFMMEDQFAYDEELDEEKDIKRKKLALKEQVASAKSHLDGLKSKYYEEIKLGSKLTNEQQEAINFYNNYNEEKVKNEDLSKKQRSAFQKETNKVFSEKFKGFEYNIGEKKFRLNVTDVDKVKQTQSDINNFVGKFLDKNKSMSDGVGYHKSLFTAMNADVVANHFYQQGKADGLKESIEQSKNVSMDPRQSHTENVNTSGLRVRALDGPEPTYKFQIKNNK